VFAARLPNMKKELCESAQLQPTNARLSKAKRCGCAISSRSTPTLRVLVVGAIHGDELSSCRWRFN
jgi:predicted deacylase